MTLLDFSNLANPKIRRKAEQTSIITVANCNNALDSSCCMLSETANEARR
jgi:hypothetical protein